MHRLEDKFIRIIRGDDTSWQARSMRGLLWLLSKIYKAVILARLFCYRHRIFRQTIAGCPVISVGNITVGGTGKTPVVEILARSLAKGGRKVAILSRGYKKKKKFVRHPKKASNIGLVSDGKVIFLDSKEAGDEPYMLARNLDGVRVLADKNRVRAGLFAIKELGADILLLDDGFQYLQLKKTHEILLVDATSPFGFGDVLPRGLLREPLGEISRAQYIFLTKTEKVADIKPIREVLHQIAPKSEIFECVHDPKYLKNVFGQDEKPLDFIRGRKICALSAIAVPEGFEDTLLRLEAQTLKSFRFRDHHRFTRRELIEVIKETRQLGVGTIITTEKDAVRIPEIHL